MIVFRASQLEALLFGCTALPDGTKNAAAFEVAAIKTTRPDANTLISFIILEFNEKCQIVELSDAEL